jgi:hypothetical protein
MNERRMAEARLHLDALPAAGLTKDHLWAALGEAKKG